MFAIKNIRTFYILLILAFWLGINLLTRAVLLYMASTQMPGASGGWESILQIFCMGTLNDLFPFFFLILPLLTLCLLPEAFWTRRYGRLLTTFFFWIYCSLILFGALAEIFFWKEFGSRFNFIAVDYLIYTTEVIRNIYESFPVIPLLLGLLGISAVISYVGWARIPKISLSSTRNWACIFTLVLLASLSFLYQPLTPSSTVPRELASNGIWSLFSAYRHNQLDYRQFYPIIDNTVAEQHIHDLLKAENTRFLSNAAGEWRRAVTSTRQAQNWNVIQIVVESLGSNLLGPNTPSLNSIIPQSLYLSNLRATGTRTVRGIEALTLSIPPTPGSSIVRRPGCEGLFNIGTVFRQKGYDTSFVYGGYGYFDNMNAFFAGNGFRIVDRSTLKDDEITFTTAWGVCDEDLFQASLREADACFKQNKPFYQFVLTTSNHRPFTYPEGKVRLPSGSGRAGAVQYTDYAIGEFLKKASKRPWFKNTVFVITGDHTSGAAGRTDLPPSRYLIPGIIYSPGNIVPRSISTLCSQIDIPPTLFDLMGWSYYSSFFGRSVLNMPQHEGRAWIGTYQLLGYITEDSITTLAPLKQPSIRPWNGTAEDGGNTPDSLLSSKNILDALASYQTAHDLFSSGKLSENSILDITSYAYIRHAARFSFNKSGL